MRFFVTIKNKQRTSLRRVSVFDLFTPTEKVLIFSTIRCIIKETRKTFSNDLPLIDKQKYNHRILRALSNQTLTEEAVTKNSTLSQQDKRRLVFHNAVLLLSYTTNLKDVFVSPQAVMYYEKANDIYC